MTSPLSERQRIRIGYERLRQQLVELVAEFDRFRRMLYPDMVFVGDFGKEVLPWLPEADELVQEARQALNFGEFQGAADLCDRALAIDPACWGGKLNKVVALANLGRLSYEDSFAGPKSQLFARMELQMVADKAASLDRADQLLTELESEVPSGFWLSVIYGNHAWVASIRNSLVGHIADLTHEQLLRTRIGWQTRAIEADPHNGEARAALGILLLQTGQSDAVADIWGEHLEEADFLQCLHNELENFGVGGQDALRTYDPALCDRVS